MVWEILAGDDYWTCNNPTQILACFAANPSLKDLALSWLHTVRLLWVAAVASTLFGTQPPLSKSLYALKE